MTSFIKYRIATILNFQNRVKGNIRKRKKARKQKENNLVANLIEPKRLPVFCQVIEAWKLLQGSFSDGK